MVRERLEPFTLTGDPFPVHNAHKGLGGAAGWGLGAAWGFGRRIKAGETADCRLAAPRFLCPSKMQQGFIDYSPSTGAEMKVLASGNRAGGMRCPLLPLTRQRQAEILVSWVKNPR